MASLPSRDEQKFPQQFEGSYTDAYAHPDFGSSRRSSYENSEVLGRRVRKLENQVSLARAVLENILRDIAKFTDDRLCSIDALKADVDKSLDLAVSWNEIAMMFRDAFGNDDDLFEEACAASDHLNTEIDEQREKNEQRSLASISHIEDYIINSLKRIDGDDSPFMSTARRSNLDADEDFKFQTLYEALNAGTANKNGNNYENVKWNL